LNGPSPNFGLEGVGQRLQLLVENGSIKLIPRAPLSEMRGYLRGMDTKVERDEEERF
jgi:hypothetical protein